MALVKRYKRIRGQKCIVKDDQVFVVKIYEDLTESDPIPSGFNTWNSSYQESEPSPKFIEWLRNFEAVHKGREELVEVEEIESLHPKVFSQVGTILLRADKSPFSHLGGGQDQEEKEKFDFRGIHLSQLERFLKLERMFRSELKEAEQRSLNMAIATRYFDCRDAGLEGEARDLMRKFGHRRHTKRKET